MTEQPKVTLKMTPTTEDDELFCRYDGQYNPQPALLTLNLESGELSCAYSTTIDSGQSMRSFCGLDIEWVIPPLTVKGVSALYDAVREDCQALLDSAAISWDGSNFRGECGVDRRDAVQHAIDQLDSSNPDLVHEVWDAADYFESCGFGQVVLDDIGLAVNASEDQISAKAAEEVALAKTENKITLDFDDVEQFLRDCIDNALYEKEE